MRTINHNIHSVTAFAPATCANIAVGFDILGFALETVGDKVTLTKRNDHQIVIENIQSALALPLEIDKNTASVVVHKLCHDLNITTGFSLNINKGIPVSSGMGGSAASAVAALVALNAFLELPLSPAELVKYALLGEEVASGEGHADNIVPCLYGGITLIQSLTPITIVALPIPELLCVMIHPHIQVTTKYARSILNNEITLNDHVKQSGQLAGLIAALYKNDFALLKNSLNDFIVERQRAHLVKGFYQVKDAGLKAGAMGVSLSGSGPSLFALVKDNETAITVSKAMQVEFQKVDIHSDAWISPIAHEGAHVTVISEA